MQFRKKPVVIEARRFETNNAPDDSHMDALVAWINNSPPRDYPRLVGPIASHDGTHIHIRTLEGEMHADVGDWIIQGVKGEF